MWFKFFINWKNLTKLIFNSNKPHLNLNEIFNTRELYTTNVKITPEYIKFIRPLNETEEAEYNKIIPKKKDFLNNNLFKK